ncbi:MAG: hypothetical protein H0U74_03485 [Bradymonadaceae bacterium]|nr:hypothetical protein [Lujinxingiaceae bacterium]
MSSNSPVVVDEAEVFCQYLVRMERKRTLLGIALALLATLVALFVIFHFVGSLAGVN